MFNALLYSRKIPLINISPFLPLVKDLEGLALIKLVQSLSVDKRMLVSNYCINTPWSISFDIVVLFQPCSNVPGGIFVIFSKPF